MDATSKNEQSLGRIQVALGVTGLSLEEVLAQAADRLEKASRIMDQIQALRPLAVAQGFEGTSASQLLQFAQNRLQEGSKAKSIEQLAQVCEALDPELAFDEAHLEGHSDALFSACVRTIGSAASKISAQETTIASLVQSLRDMPGGWAPDQQRSASKTNAPQP
jgi:hypothetical protein